MTKLAHHTRWDIRATEDGGLRVCRGLHEEGAEHVWEEFIPRPVRHAPKALTLEPMSAAPRDGRFILALSRYGWDIICAARDEWYGMARGGEDGDEYYVGWTDLDAAPWGFFCWDALPEQKP